MTFGHDGERRAIVLGEQDVVVGTPVARGTVLGTLDAGHPGCPAPACLHWGLRWRSAPAVRREQYLDPLLLVGLGRTRLWPS